MPNQNCAIRWRHEFCPETIETRLSSFQSLTLIESVRRCLQWTLLFAVNVISCQDILRLGWWRSDVRRIFSLMTALLEAVTINREEDRKTCGSFPSFTSTSEKGGNPARSMWPTWGPPGCCRPQVGPTLSPWTLLSGKLLRWSFDTNWSDTSADSPHNRVSNAECVCTSWRHHVRCRT